MIHKPFQFDGSFVCSPDGCIWWAELNVDLEPGEEFNVNLYRPNICYIGWMIPHVDRARNTVKFTVNHLINISSIQQVLVSRTVSY